MNIVIYTRVSTVEQAELNKSLKNQEDACRLYASKKPDWNVAKVYTEKGESAKTTDRTELKEMLTYCRKNYKSVDAVMVWKLDRLARKTEDHIALANIFAKLNIQLVSATEALE